MEEFFMDNKKTLVAFFSCSGTTRRAAQLVAEATDADLYEIKPEIPYTQADLDWTNKKSRSTVEMNDLSSRPAISSKVENMDVYDTVFVGFPIWWYVAPTIINTFLESYDFSGKTVIPFATSGGSGLGETEKKLRPSCSGSTNWKTGKLLNRGDKASLKAWIEELGLNR